MAWENCLDIMRQGGRDEIASADPEFSLFSYLCPRAGRNGGSKANRAFNEFISNRNLPVPITHDHFIGRPGGFAIFYVQNSLELDALLDSLNLPDWQVEIQPLIFSRSPAGFDEQTAFTLHAYRDLDWEELQRQQRPSYGDPSRETETAEEDLEKPEG